jgi:pimeloyl-ACP methyl ester carboxylesterase
MEIYGDLSTGITFVLLAASTIYQLGSSWWEDSQLPPGKLVDVGGYQLHLCIMRADEFIGSDMPTIVLDHSLGGVEGYLLLSEISKLAPVCIYDRAGYGWSDRSPHPRTSEQIVMELDTLLTRAEIAPPYILLGDSFGSYNVRLYAASFPEKVVGMVLTDGLHEAGMLKMSYPLQALKLFFTSGFVMSTLGAFLGIIRLLNLIGLFELLKPELANFSKPALNAVKRSFCRPKHWITMAQEIIGLDRSGNQVKSANKFGDLPIVSIKATSFFQPSFWTIGIPLRAANDLRDQMHDQLLKLSTDCTQIQADKSGHFVWVDQPDAIASALKVVLEKVRSLH